MQADDTRSPVEQDDASDYAIMGFLLDDPVPWSEEELIRQFRQPFSVQDELSRLAGEGMIHRHGGFVFTTRAARQAHETYGG